MIKLDELRPILEELEVSADTIEKIVAIDTHSEGTIGQEKIDELNAQWEKRFKDAFFKPEEKEPDTVIDDINDTEENPYDNESIDDILFEKGDEE